MAGEAEYGSSHGNRAPRVGIGVGKKNGKLALQYALDCVIPADTSVCLLYVQTPPRFMPPGGSGKYPIEYKQQIFLEAQGLVNEYIAMCHKRKVKTEVFNSESETVEKGLLDQVFKLGLTTLVVAKSYKNAVSRPVESISAYVAAYAPSFCTVIIVHKGRLLSIRYARQSSSSHSSSPLPITCSAPTPAPSDVSTSNLSETSRQTVNLFIRDQNSDDQARDDLDMHEHASTGSNIANNESSVPASSDLHLWLDEAEKSTDSLIQAAERQGAIVKMITASARQMHANIESRLDEISKKLKVECQLRKEAEATIALHKGPQQFFKYSFQELQAATNNFSYENKLGEGILGPVYRGRLHHLNVAIKVLAREGSPVHVSLQNLEIELLSRIHHPHIMMLLGSCHERGCLVYEYMANGSLEDNLNCKNGRTPLPWYTRLKICQEVAIALLFLHSHSQPIIHGNLKSVNIFIDHHFVSKIADVRLVELLGATNAVPVPVMMYLRHPDYHLSNGISYESDVYSLGILILQLLTGRQAGGVFEIVEDAMQNGHLENVLYKLAGEWPLAEATELALLGLQCADPRKRNRPNLGRRVIPQLEKIQSMAAAKLSTVAGACSFSTEPITPSCFFCPISEEIMENPHMAADGFTYEYNAIKAWLQEHNTSPMTNLALDHKNLIPNHSIRSAIKQWHDLGLLPD